MTDGQIDSVVAGSPTEDASQIKTLHQHQINDLVKGAKEAGYHKGKSDALAEFQAQSVPQATQNISGNSMGGMPNVDPNAVRQMVEEHAAKFYQNQMMQQSAHQTAHQFQSKMIEARNRIPGFDEKMSKLGSLTNFPEIVHLANSVPNTGEVMADLADNPQKISSLLVLHARSPQAAATEMQRLAHSIQTNQAGQQERSAPEPLDQIKPSVNAGNSDTVASIKHFKSKYRG
jgi:hypothetical protein